jgi:hypothetical protein
LDPVVLQFLRHAQPLLHNVRLSLMSKDEKHSRHTWTALEHLLPLFTGIESIRCYMHAAQLLISMRDRWPDKFYGARVISLFVNGPMMVSGLAELLARWLGTKHGEMGRPQQPRTLVINAIGPVSMKIVQLIQEVLINHFP